MNEFKKSFKNVFNHSLILFAKSFNVRNSLENQIINFANLTNFVALKGGAIKREQMLSGDMADIFSNLYLACSVKYYHDKYQASDKLTNYIINRLLDENQIKINTVINNLGAMKYLLCHMKKVRNKKI